MGPLQQLLGVLMGESDCEGEGVCGEAVPDGTGLELQGKRRQMGSGRQEVAAEVPEA